MHKDEYLHQLTHALNNIPEHERTEILADYEEHFIMGLADNRTEEEIAKALGDPRTIGREYAAISLIKRAEENPSAGGMSRAVTATVGLGIFNLLVVFIPFCILLFLIALVLVIGFSLACSGPFFVGYSVLELAGIVNIGLPVPPHAGVFFGIGLTSSGLLLMVLDFVLVRVLYRLGIRYLKWNIAVISGRETI